MKRFFIQGFLFGVIGWTSFIHSDIVYVGNYDSGTVSVINTTTGTIQNISLGSQTAYGLAISPNASTVYVTDYYRGTNSNASIITTNGNTLSKTINVGPLPAGVAFTPDGQRVYVVNANDGDESTGSVAVINTATQTLQETITLGSDPYNKPYWIAIAQTVNGVYAYVTCDGSDQVYVINTDTNSVVGSPLTVGNYPHGIAIADTSNGIYAYVANGDDGTVSVIDTASNTITGTISIPDSDYLHGVAATPNGKIVLVTDADDDVVYIIDTDTNTVTNEDDPIAVGSYPNAIAVNSQGTFAYVSNSGDGELPSGSVSMINLSTLSVSTISTGNYYPVGIAVLPAVLAAPQNLTGQQKANNFGLTKEYFNALSWDPIPSSKTAGYRIYRGSTLIATVDANTLQYQDHNQSKKVSVTYQVVGITSNGTEGAAANSNCSLIGGERSI